MCTTHVLVQETAQLVAQVSVECKLPVEVDEYVESFSPYLMDIMYAWSRGSSFAQICSMTGAWVGGWVHGGQAALDSAWQRGRGLGRCLVQQAFERVLCVYVCPM
jgi:superfamily II RNA helicase